MAARFPVFPDDTLESEQTKLSNEENFTGKLERLVLISSGLRMSLIFVAWVLKWNCLLSSFIFS